jgi:hypothetical protein
VLWNEGWLLWSRREGSCVEGGSGGGGMAVAVMVMGCVEGREERM